MATPAEAGAPEVLHGRRSGRARVNGSEDVGPDGSEPDGAGRPAAGLSAAEIGGDLGERATLVQFSSAFCAPCRATRRVLGEVAAMVPGVAHVEIDAEARLDLVRALGILKTPTVLVLDAHGREVRRAAGQPRKADVIAALGEAV
ncbi:TlpA family protein disulfide reductase [Streptomyces sp. KHY 26]|uniref:TlpA family protein disulfide reductase n=1 Tax=Streptomyces sp. KHY 26 TaxID=3097359 RepID=UPI00376EA938